MSIETQTLDPKEQNRTNFMRRDRKQDHGTRGTHTGEHDYRNEERMHATAATSSLTERMGLRAIKEALSLPRPSTAELEKQADAFLIEAGEDVETFHIPVDISEEEELTVAVHTSRPLGYANELGLKDELKIRQNRKPDVEKEYEGTTEDDNGDPYSGISFKHRP